MRTNLLFFNKAPPCQSL
uniref:Uncharacterized protein n=1 Tax=Anguilla anguilla TaxID=7936 RepID=A0A0E9USI1_ANGAN